MSDSAAKSSEVPKFGSFRPRHSGTSGTRESTDTTKKDELKDERQHRSREHNRHRQPKDTGREHRRHRAVSPGRRERLDEHPRRRRSRTRSPVSRHVREAVDEAALAKLQSASDTYVVDRRGDPNNLTYGSLHRYSIPPYHRIGFGRVLGLSSSYRINSSASSESNLVLDNQTTRVRPERGLLKRQRDTRKLRLIRPGQGDSTSTPDESFIALGPSRKRKRGSESPEPVDYRSIEGKAKDDRPADEDLEFVTDSDEHEEDASIEEQMRILQGQLLRRTKESPEDVDAWLALIAHQAQMVKPGANIHDLTGLQRRTVADLRLSLYEKALRVCKSSEARQSLLQGLLDEGGLVWDAQKKAQKWQDVLGENPTNMKLWANYLDFIQSNHLGFRYEETKAAYMHCLQKLKGLIENSSEPTPIHEVQMYVFIRMTKFIQEAGYEELAVAMWQTIVEFVIFAPALFDIASHSELIDAFQEFWESEVPRFGEKGAYGWHNSMRSTTADPADGPIAPRQTLTPNQPFRSFASLEESLSTDHALPGKTIDDAESDDPYHTVLFADISGVLEVVPQTHDSRSIIEGFLCFFGMPPLHECDHYASSWRLDTCLRDTGPQDLKGLPNYRTTTSNLFSSAFADFPCQGMYKEFVQRALSTLVQLYALDESFAVYHFAYEYHLNPATAYTATRKLLKDRPSSLRLYNACALIEAGRGRGERANHIWRTAIGMSARKFMPDGDAGALFLWRNWIWNSLRTGDRKTALSQVLSIGSDPPDAALPEEDQSSAASLLRVRRVLRDGFHHSLYHGLHDEIALYAECLALLTYLTDNAQLESALRVFHRYSDHVTTRFHPSVALELLHQAKADLISHHIDQKRPYKPALLRADLEHSIGLFPNNTLFLQLFSSLESRHRLDDRVRALFRSHLATEDSTVVSWAFAISEEVQRFREQASGSTADSARGLFAKALLASGSPVRHSPYLWGMWLDVEKELVRNAERKGKEQAKKALQALAKVFLDGLRFLPWSKRWVIRGLRLFERDDGCGWTVGELRKVYDVLGERELRVRAEGFEELLDRVEASER